MIRHIFELCSRHVVLKRKLPKQFQNGPLLVTPDASLKYWNRDLSKVDPMLLNLALEQIRPGSVVWDIGANVGLFSFACANLVGQSGKVLAIEADIWLAGLMRRSSRLKENHGLQIDILPMAVSDSVGIAKFNIAKRGRAASYLDISKGSTQAGGVREVQLVPTFSLDWLLDRYARPTFVKIDVEGAEEKVLRGAEKVLAEIRPIILCEVSENKEIVSNIFKKFNYSLFDAAAEKHVRKALDFAPYDTLAFPSQT